jgi:hypothetical protein
MTGVPPGRLRRLAAHGATPHAEPLRHHEAPAANVVPINAGVTAAVDRIGQRHASENASAANMSLINALRHGGDLLNVFGDFPTLADRPRRVIGGTRYLSIPVGQNVDGERSVRSGRAEPAQRLRHRRIVYRSFDTAGAEAFRHLLHRSARL